MTHVVGQQHVPFFSLWGIFSKIISKRRFYSAMTCWQKSLHRKKINGVLVRLFSWVWLRQFSNFFVLVFIISPDYELNSFFPLASVGRRCEWVERLGLKLSSPIHLLHFKSILNPKQLALEKSNVDIECRPRKSFRVVLLLLFLTSQWKHNGRKIQALLNSTHVHWYSPKDSPCLFAFNSFLSFHILIELPEASFVRLFLWFFLKCASWSS